MKEKKAFIPRIAQRLLREGIESFPVTLITGARQTGKLTLIREELKGISYLTLDDLDVYPNNFKSWFFPSPTSPPLTSSASHLSI